MKNWAYIVTIPDVGAIAYGKAYFEKANIVNPLTAAPYTDEEIKAIVNGVSEGANDYTLNP